MRTGKEFWASVKIAQPNECWLWQKATNTDGYGILNWRGKIDKAHRVAYSLSVGEILQGQSILHQCDTRSCCNPRHLFTGTQADNVRDMIEKEIAWVGVYWDRKKRIAYVCPVPFVVFEFSFNEGEKG